MRKSMHIAGILLLISVFAFAGTTGKISGKATNNQTGEAWLGVMYW